MSEVRGTAVVERKDCRTGSGLQSGWSLQLGCNCMAGLLNTNEKRWRWTGLTSTTRVPLASTPL